jgi:type I restriction enzyme R subunit
LPQKHSILWDTFKEVKNRQDQEEYEVQLADPSLREKFYDRLSAYARSLGIALSSVRFLEETPPSKIDRYKGDLKFFAKVRGSVRQRYAEVVDFSEYEPKIQKLLDRHVGTGEIEKLTPLVNIFEKEAFALEVEKVQGTAARADTIAHRTEKAINEHMHEDPAFYKKFSQMLKETILAFREERIRETEYLEKVQSIMESVLNRTGDKIPARLEEHEVAKAYFGIINEAIPAKNDEADFSDDTLAELALQIEAIIENNRKVNWASDIDVQNTMRNEIEDLIFDFKEESRLEISFDIIDEIMEQCLGVAKVRRP